MSTRPPIFSVGGSGVTWYWIAVSANGQTITRSWSTYSTKSNATRAMRRFLDGVRYGGYEEVGGE